MYENIVRDVTYEMCVWLRLVCSEMSVGEMSVGEISVGEMSVDEILTFRAVICID